MSVASEEAAPPAMLLASIGFRVQPHKRGEALSAVLLIMTRTIATADDIDLSISTRHQGGANKLFERYSTPLSASSTEMPSISRPSSR